MGNFKRPFSEIEDKTKLSAWSDKNPFKPDEIGRNSNKKVWFDCVTCGHDFESVVGNVTNKNTWCPFCSNNKICENTLTCGICLPKTFYGALNDSNVGAWSEKNEFSPWEVFRGAKKKAWFDCHECGHDFECPLNDIKNKGRWCPYCANKVSSWSRKNTFEPWEVFLSNHKAWFDCKKCGHDFESTLCDVATRGGWCPYCVSKKLCPDPRECDKCLPKTFYGGSDEYKIQSWSEKNTLQPWNIFLSSSKKIWFHCNKCVNDFEAPLDHILRGDWCPKCSSKRNKAMSALISILDHMRVEYILEKSIQLNNRDLRWDAVCTFEGSEFIIESDGPHHFSARGVTRVSREKLTGDKATNAFQDQRTRDLLKETYINVNNGLLFRFSYRQTSQIESLVSKMLEIVRSGKTGVFYMDDIYW